MPKWLKNLKYPKLLLLILTFVLAYFIFNSRHTAFMQDLILSSGYIGTFLAGILYVYSFTAAPATVLLLNFSYYQNFYLAALCASLGAFVGDLMLYKLLKHSFKEELVKLANEKIIIAIKRRLPEQILKFLVPVIATLVMVTPLPDEIGIVLLASSKNVKTRTFIILSLVLNIIGIFIALYLGSLIN